MLYKHYPFPFVKNKTKQGKEERQKKQENTLHFTLEEVEDSLALVSV